jgi:hypothetical protein
MVREKRNFWWVKKLIIYSHWPEFLETEYQTQRYMSTLFLLTLPICIPWLAGSKNIHVGCCLVQNNLIVRNQVKDREHPDISTKQQSNCLIQRNNSASVQSGGTK